MKAGGGRERIGLLQVRGNVVAFGAVGAVAGAGVVVGARTASQGDVPGAASRWSSTDARRGGARETWVDNGYAAGTRQAVEHLAAQGG
ncbi:hypothetical protein [Streptomyces sp. NPDC001508]|uniref:hypothetical protein n=1 Tax=Streptomyces sp. NPDC001508 TaxID=3154656 RepID=UPI0033341F4E